MQEETQVSANKCRSWQPNTTQMKHMQQTPRAARGVFNSQLQQDKEDVQHSKRLEVKKIVKNAGTGGGPPRP
jgi:hypothetical protein